ncbi:MAG TPA: hypothetical protein VM532_08495 [Burkholderiales bacterium]|nr:hypothetical protein [Burkholderiales bacterium]
MISTQDLEHLVALLLLLSRIGDIGWSYLAIPKLLFEENPVAHRFR